MKLAVFPIPLLVVLAAASPHNTGDFISQWEPPGANDYRGPCPMMNTLANHKFLPHDGRNITQEALSEGLSAALNFNSSLSALMFKMAIVANPEPNATYFTLDHLNRHNVLEHDASLSRLDAYFGNNHIFNEATFDRTRKYWTGSTLDADMLANSKVARQIDSKAYNPTYTFTSTVEEFSLGEVAAPIIAFGDMQSMTVDRSLVEYFFRNERLPTSLGWTKPKAVVSQKDIMSVSEAIRDAASLITDTKANIAERSRDMHIGLDLQV